MVSKFQIRRDESDDIVTNIGRSFAMSAAKILVKERGSVKIEKE